MVTEEDRSTQRKTDGDRGGQKYSEKSWWWQRRTEVLTEKLMVTGEDRSTQRKTDVDRGDRSTQRKTSPSANLCTTNLTRTGLGSNRKFRVQISHGHRINTKIQSVPRSKHSVSAIQTSQLMLYREIIAVCSQIHTEHINTVCVGRM